MNLVKLVLVIVALSFFFHMSNVTAINRITSDRSVTTTDVVWNRIIIIIAKPSYLWI